MRRMQDVASVHSIYAGMTEEAQYRLKKVNLEQRPAGNGVVSLSGKQRW